MSSKLYIWQAIKYKWNSHETPTETDLSKKQLEADTNLIDQSKKEPNPEDYSNLLAATKKRIC